MGVRYATSVGDTLTGRGGNFLIVDDPIKSDEVMSEAERTQGQPLLRQLTLLSAEQQERGRDHPDHAAPAPRRPGQARAGQG